MNKYLLCSLLPPRQRTPLRNVTHHHTGSCRHYHGTQFEAVSIVDDTTVFCTEETAENVRHAIIALYRLWGCTLTLAKMLSDGTFDHTVIVGGLLLVLNPNGDSLHLGMA